MSDIDKLIERAEAALAKSWNARSDTERAGLVPKLVAALKTARAQRDEFHAQLDDALAENERRSTVLSQIREYAEAWADPGAGDAIVAIIDRTLLT